MTLAECIAIALRLARAGITIATRIDPEDARIEIRVGRRGENMTETALVRAVTRRELHQARPEVLCGIANEAARRFMVGSKKVEG